MRFFTGDLEWRFELLCLDRRFLERELVDLDFRDLDLLCFRLLLGDRDLEALDEDVVEVSLSDEDELSEEEVEEEDGSGSRFLERLVFV